MKKRATAKFEAKDKAGAQALRAKAQGLAPPDDKTTEVPHTKAPATPARGPGRPRKVTETPNGHRKRAASDACEVEEGESPSKKAKGDGDAPAPSTPSSEVPSTPSSHVKPHRGHRKRRVVVSSPTIAAADEEEEGQEEGEDLMVTVASPTTHTPSRKRVASAELEDASPSKKLAAATAATDVAMAPEPTMVEDSGVAGAQADGSPATAADDYVGGRGKKGVVSLPTLHDILDGVVKQEGGHEARMRFEGSMLGEVQDLAIREGKNEESGVGDEEEEDEDEDEEDEQRMQEGMGQVEMTFE